MPEPSTSPTDPLLTEQVRGYRIGYAERPTAADLDALLPHVAVAPRQSSDPLKGRLETATITLPDAGRVVLKRYARGGLMRFITRQKHLRSRVPRAAAEFQTLAQLAVSGLSVPQPIVWGESGLLLVENWLVVAEIPQALTLAEIARGDTRRAEALLPEVANTVGRLIALGVHHVDFHPGNVLIDDQNTVFPIDFDKAITGCAGRVQLAERYRSRWNRAIVKHGLPPALEFSADSLSV